MSAARDVPTLSKNHRLVYEIVQEAGHGTHLSMSELYEKARMRRPAIGFTTVYRALARLGELGLVAEIALPGAERSVYEPASAPHAHFSCSLCGRVEDVEYAVPDAVTRKLATARGFEIDRAVVSLHGRCASCCEAARPK